jgi:ketosteroid isomerase-like protein
MLYRAAPHSWQLLRAFFTRNDILYIFPNFTQTNTNAMNSKIRNTKQRLFKFIPLLLLFLFAVIKANAQTTTDNDARAKEITDAMNNSANEWNKGNLDAFMNLYDPSATMMMPTGPVGLDAIRNLYEKKYFNGNMPKQNLRYTDMKVHMLGTDYALLIGSFTLYDNNLPERSGRYSLVIIRTKNGWKILHDHSS